MSPGEDRWPDLPADLRRNSDAKKARAAAIASAIVELAKGRRTSQAEHAKADDALNQKLVETLGTLATGGIDRARAGAQFVQTAAGAIAGLYTGVLGVLFVSGHAAPSRSFIPMLFLGLAIVLVSVYLAFVIPGKSMDRPRFLNIPDEDIWVRLNYVSEWVRQITLSRSWALRAGVVSLAVALLFLPVAVVRFPAEVPMPEWNLAAGRALVSFSSATPQATPIPTPIPWPSPTILPDPSLSAILYSAQLDQFRKNLATPEAASDPSRDNAIAWNAALLGLLAIVLVAWDPWSWFKPRLLKAGQVIIPTYAEET